VLGFLAVAKWGAAFLAVVALALLSYRGLLPASSYDINVLMPGADGLYPGSDVLIAGSRAGSVSGITLHGSDVLVGVSLDPAYSPIHTNATITLRPKSLLGERYLDLNPGNGGDSLNPGATIAATRVSISTDLQDVINTFDEPTRDKLQVVITELGGGFAGRGVANNETIHYGTQDLTDLAQLATTLEHRDAELQKVIQALDTVTAELAQSDRRQQLGQLIANSDRLIKNLADQDAALKRALSQTNAALAKTDVALSGTQGNLASIFQQTPTLVHRTDLLMSDLATTSNSAVTALPAQAAAIRETAIVFGGRDANGYATRISVLVGASTTGAGPSGGSPSASAPPGGLATPAAVVPASGGSSDTDLWKFLLGRPI
jgi:phospholipid/cholesterol/gamma-HCH transport system substrate-binding protein